MADLSPRADDLVSDVRAKAGQRVHVGDAFVALDTREAKHELAKAEAKLRIAQSEARAAHISYAAAVGRARRREGITTMRGRSCPIVSAEELT